MTTKRLFRARVAGALPLLALVSPALAQGYPANPYPSSPYPANPYPTNPYPSGATSNPASTPYRPPMSMSDGDPLAMQLRTLAIAPRSLSALLGAGQAALAGGDATAALGFFARAEQVEPGSAAAKAGLASCLVALEKPDDALRLFAEASRLGMPDGAIVKDRALAYDLRGDPRSAQRDYAQALRANPGDPETLRRYALSLGISGDRSGAITQLEPLLRRKDPGAWRARAFILAMTGDVGGADAIARQMMPAGMAAQMAPFMKRLASLNPADRAHAVNFGTMPAAGQSFAAVQTGDPYRGRAVMPPTDDRRIAYAAPPPVRVPERFPIATPARVPAVTPDSALIPQGEPLGTRPTIAPVVSTAVARLAVTERPARRADVPVVTVPGVDSFAVPVQRVTPRPVAAPPPAVRIATASTVPALTASARTITAPTTSAPTASAPTAAALTTAAPSTPVLSANTPAPGFRDGAIAAPLVTPAATPAYEIAARPIVATPVPVPTPTRAVAAIATATVPTVATGVVSQPFGAVTEPGRATSVPLIQPDATATTIAASPPAVALATANVATVPATASTPVATNGAVRAPRLAGLLAGLTTEAESAAVALPSADVLRLRTLAAAKKAQAAADAKAAAQARADAAAADAAAAKADADAQAAEEKRFPARLWVQVATGANTRALPGTWTRLEAKHPALKGKTAWSADFKATNRLLVGPLKSSADARALIAALAKDGLSATTYNSDAGQEIARLGGR